MTMRAIRPTVGLACLTAVATVPLLAFAQDPAPKAAPLKLTPPPGQRYAGLDFQSRVGSFKFVPPSEDLVSQGELKMSFTGTVLLSGLEPGSTIEVSSGVRKEFDSDTMKGDVYKKMKRVVYHGTGTLRFYGKARAIQFFGRDMKAHFFGLGILRLYGEFDKNLETGTYKYAGSETTDAWGTGGRNLVIPSREQATPKPRVKVGG